MNGEEISGDALRKILDGAADYIVFDDAREYAARNNDLASLKILGRFIPREVLFRQARHNFFAYQNFEPLANILRDNKISRMLDVDGLFAETDFFLFPEKFPRVDGVGKNYDPIHENFY